MRNKLYEIVLSAYARFKVFKWGLGRYLKSEEGATAVEYALVIGVIVIGIISVASLMIPQLQIFFLNVVTQVQGLVTSATSTGGGAGGGATP